MRKDIECLLDLQNWDLETRKLGQDAESFTLQRADYVNKVLKARELAKILHEKYNTEETKRRQLEKEIEVVHQQKDKFSTQQLQTRKNEEYRAFQSQIENCDKRISELETQLLEQMEITEKANDDFIKQQQKNLESEKGYKKAIEEIDDSKKKILAKLAEHNRKRDSIAISVVPELLSKYERKRKKGGAVVVGIHHGACEGCHTKLTTQTIIMCKDGLSEDVTECPFCGRILYFTPDMGI